MSFLKIDIPGIMDKFHAMINTMILIILTLIGFKLFMTRELAAENLALRLQLAVLQRKSTRPQLKTWDRVFWALLSKIWSKWREAGRRKSL